jgi:ketosteroid isomerase-like protein
MKHFGFGIVLAGLLVIALFGSSEAKAQPGSSTNGFKAFLVESDAAQVELQSGKAGPYKAVWSHTDDVTISGGFGGTIEKGWANVSKRLDWAATQFSQGTNTIERLVAYSEGNLGYVVQLEHIKFKVPATGADATRDFRVSMVFRRERGKWKIVHRHADGNMTKQPAQ